MTARSSLTIVLAAGEGTRMRSSLPKVLHEVAGQSLLAHVLAAAPKANGAALAVVIGPDHQVVADEVETRAYRRADLRSARTSRHRACRARRTRSARARRRRSAGGVRRHAADFGRDTGTLRAPLKNGAALAVLGFRAADPTGYGRLLVEGEQLVAIREHADASAGERAIKLCNAGVMAFDGRRALEIIEKIGNANGKGEYYLTDAVEMCARWD